MSHSFPNLLLPWTWCPFCTMLLEKEVKNAYAYVPTCKLNLRISFKLLPTGIGCKRKTQLGRSLI